MEMSDLTGAEMEDAGQKLRLKVAEGNAAGTVIEVEDELVIGRQAVGEGSLAGDIEMSRQHARVASGKEGSFTIEDLGSTNGTYVNGRRIEGPTVLETGDRIEVGSSVLVVQVSAIPGTPAYGTEVPVPADSPAAPTADEPPAAGAAPEGAAEAAGEAEEPAVGAPAPTRMSLRIEVDLEAGRATLALDEQAEEIQLVLEDGRWRLG